jgi:GNAT superfamily N-acetyltransferase
MSGELELRTLEGPLEEAQLSWIAALYGRTDARYALLDFLRHQLLENPYGWSLHTFAFDGTRRVGHCEAVPVKARLGTEELLSVKLEALFVDPEYRGARVRR